MTDTSTVEQALEVAAGRLYWASTTSGNGPRSALLLKWSEETRAVIAALAKPVASPDAPTPLPANWAIKESEHLADEKLRLLRQKLRLLRQAFDRRASPSASPDALVERADVDLESALNTAAGRLYWASTQAGGLVRALLVKWSEETRDMIAALTKPATVHDAGLVGRVARAMVAAQFNDWDQLDGGDHGYWCSMAQAAIETLSSPRPVDEVREALEPFRELIAEDAAAEAERTAQGIMPAYHSRSVTAQARLYRAARDILPGILDRQASLEGVSDGQ